jgi:hypothetical protein
MTTMETGLKVSSAMRSLMKPPAIIPNVRGAGNIALSKKLWVALYLNWKMNNSTDKLEEVARMFIRTYPKRLDIIEHTAKHFVILQGIYYGFMSNEYDLALFNILEHADQHGDADMTTGHSNKVP